MPLTMPCRVETAACASTGVTISATIMSRFIAILLVVGISPPDSRAGGVGGSPRPGGVGTRGRGPLWDLGPTGPCARACYCDSGPADVPPRHATAVRRNARDRVGTGGRTG